jgi:hypothetical protein
MELNSHYKFLHWIVKNILGGFAQTKLIFNANEGGS